LITVSSSRIFHHLQIMFTSARRWLRNNRTPIAVGVGVIGVGYVATQYVVGKLNDARERMSSDRIAKEK
jgi:peroxin-3